MLAVLAGVDLLCLGRDTDEAMYHAVRGALADAVTSGRLAGTRLEAAAARVAAPRMRLGAARSAQLAEADGVTGTAIGLTAARRALRRSGPVPAALANPLVIEVEPEENIAAGPFTWGFEPWAATVRVSAGHGNTGHGSTGPPTGPHPTRLR